VREVIQRHFDERSSLNVFPRDGVEGNIDASGLLGHFRDVLLEGLLIERIDFSGLGRSACCTDILGHSLEL
jgi:hypothetical protein